MIMEENGPQQQQNEGRGNNRRQFTANIPVPAKLDVSAGNLSQNWKRFKRHWDNYIVASRLSEEDQNFQCAVFLATVGEDALDIFDGLKFDSDADRKNLITVMQKFEQFCVGQTHEAYESYKFHLKKTRAGRND